MTRKIVLPIIVLSLMSPTVFANKNTHQHGANHQHSGMSNNKNEGSQYGIEMSKNTAQGQHMDAISIIMQDHAHIRDMIARLDKILDSNNAESRAKFKELKDFLVKHETMEQKVWYPALEKKHVDLKDIIAQLKKEEQDAGNALKKIDGIKDNQEWTAQVKKLMKDVDHHANQEETQLFPKVKSMVDAATLNAIGAKLNNYRKSNKMKY